MVKQNKKKWIFDSCICVIKGLFGQQLCPNEIAVHDEVSSSIYGNFKGVYTQSFTNKHANYCLLIYLFFTFVNDKKKRELTSLVNYPR